MRLLSTHSSASVVMILAHLFGGGLPGLSCLNAAQWGVMVLERTFGWLVSIFLCHLVVE